MIKKREGYRVVVIEPAKSWIGQNRCGGCGLKKTAWKRRKDWKCCSSKCTKKFLSMYYHFGWSDMRDKVFERDKNTCQVCGFIAVATKEVRDYFGEEREFNVKTISSQLDADHILPIALGGDEWEFKNIQTLCKVCHKAKTKVDMKRISVERKVPHNQKRIGEVLR